MSDTHFPCLIQFALSTGSELTACAVQTDKSQRIEQKLAHLTRYVQQHPTGWKKRLQRADLLCVSGDWHAAVEEYRRVITAQPDLLDVRLRLGKLLYLMDAHTEAAAVYVQALMCIDHPALRQHVTALQALCQHEVSTTVQALTEAVALEPDNPAHHLALAQTHLSFEQTVEAVAAFEALLALIPQDVHALLGSYDALLVAGDMDTAQQRLTQLVELAPADFRVLQRQVDYRCQQGWVSGTAGQHTKRLIKQLLKQTPHFAGAWAALAHYHRQRGETAKALAVLQEFTTNHPAMPDGWYVYGRCLSHSGAHSQAVAALQQAYTLAPRDYAIRRALCEVLAAAGALEALCPLLDTLVCDFPERWRGWVTAGELLVTQFQELERGCTLSARAVVLQPHLGVAWQHHARVLELAGRVEAAERIWAVWQNRS